MVFAIWRCIKENHPTPSLLGAAPFAKTRTAVMADVLLGGETTPYLTLNRNKKSLALDLKAQQGREVLYRLAKTADALVPNFRPGVADRMWRG